MRIKLNVAAHPRMVKVRSRKQLICLTEQTLQNLDYNRLNWNLRTETLHNQTALLDLTLNEEWHRVWRCTCHYNFSGGKKEPADSHRRKSNRSNCGPNNPSVYAVVRAGYQEQSSANWLRNMDADISPCE